MADLDAEDARLVDALRTLLADLGDTPDDVADRLRALDIKGLRAAACDCPVARFLERQPGYELPAVSPTDLGVDVRDGDRYIGTVEIVVPPAIAAFIERFDAGVYLDLVEAA